MPAAAPRVRNRILKPGLLKWAGAGLILCCLFLPMYSCRAQAGWPPATTGKVYHYFIGDLSPRDPVDWFRLAGVLWPVVAAWGASRLGPGWWRRLFLAAEPLLLCATALSLCLGAMFGTKELGFWLAWAGVVLYGAGGTWMDLTLLASAGPRWTRTRRILAGAGIVSAFLGAAVGSVLVFFNGFRP